MDSVINTVGGKLTNTAPGEGGDNDIGSIVLSAMKAIRKLVNAVAVLIVVITGFLLVTSQDEGQMGKARNTLIAAITAMVLINVAEPLASGLKKGFVGSSGSGADASSGANIITDEILGLIDFVEEPLLAVAVLMIIVSGSRAVMTFGSDQGMAQIRRTLISILSGIVIVGTKFALAEAMAGKVKETNPNNIRSDGIVDVFVGVAKIAVSFMALAAVTVIVIAGIIMVLNKGDQETATKARGLIIRVIIGLLVILISFGIVLVFAQIPG